jgi:lipopolysaccharide export system permease protein
MPMKILDRYIIRSFLLNFVILTFVLMALFILIDVIIDLDEFLGAGEMYAQHWAGMDAQGRPGFLLKMVGVGYALFDFYGPLVVLVYVYFSGLLVVGAMGFTLSALTRSREIAAIVTSGVSMYRIAMPLVVTGFILSAAALPIQEYVIANLALKLSRSKSQLKDPSRRTFPVFFASDGQGTLLSAAEFDIQKAQPMLRGLTICVRDAQGQAVRQITAEQGWWDAAREGWELVQGYAVQTAVAPTDDASDRAVAPGMAVGGGLQPIDFTATAITPDMLMARRAAIYLRLLSLRELTSLLSNPAADSAAILQVMHSRFSMLVINVLVLVMVLPLFLLREPANMLVQGAKAAGLTLGSWAGGLLMLQIVISGFNPVTAAWLPVVLYLPVSVYLLQTIKS